METTCCLVDDALSFKGGFGGGGWGGWGGLMTFVLDCQPRWCSSVDDAHCNRGGFGGGVGGVFSFVVDCKQTGCSSVQMCVVTNYNQSWCSSVDDAHCDRGGFGGGVFSFVVDCKQTGCSSVQMCVVQPKLVFFGGWCTLSQGGFGGGVGGVFSFVVDCKQTGCSSVQMCVVTNCNQSWCFSVDDARCNRRYFCSLMIANRRKFFGINVFLLQKVFHVKWMMLAMYQRNKVFLRGRRVGFGSLVSCFLCKCEVGCCRYLMALFGFWLDVFGFRVVVFLGFDCLVEACTRASSYLSFVISFLCHWPVVSWFLVARSLLPIFIRLCGDITMAPKISFKS